MNETNKDFVGGSSIHYNMLTYTNVDAAIEHLKKHGYSPMLSHATFSIWYKKVGEGLAIIRSVKNIETPLYVQVFYQGMR